MHFTVICCCFVLLPYFASLVAPPQEATTCSAGFLKWAKKGNKTRDTTRNTKQGIQTKNTTSSSNISDPNQIPLKAPKLEDHWFKQKLDHYHFSNLLTWEQRYLLNEQYYDNNGTVFILIGTNEEINSEYMQTGRWIEYVKEVHALCIGIEVRHYVKTRDARREVARNLWNENLVHLNTEQALADVAWFIVNFKRIPKFNTPIKLKWVAFGRHRTGAFAAWLKMKFPHLLDAAFSLSAPLLAKANFNEYFEGIQKEMLDKEIIFKDGLEKAFNQIDIRLTLNSGYRYLNSAFNFCGEKEDILKFTKKKNIDFMYLTLAKVVAKMMQFGNDNLKQIKTDAIKLMTDFVDRYYEHKTKGHLARFGVVVKLVLAHYNIECLYIDYNRAIKNHKHTNVFRCLMRYLAFSLGDRSYLYQSCTEFGHFETFVDFFKRESTLEFYVDICTEVFGKKFDEKFLEKGVRRTNLFYGGLDIIVSHVVFVYAELDPLSKLGLTDPKTKDSVSFILEGAYQCDELDNVDYVPHINDVKEKIIKQIKEWLELS